ncbi:MULTISPECIES: GntR family transcriptional regulator [Arthrobacter]|uniref:GntR family transcriptional regulator n=1 Tax=unclassified Arthrobacter TaxID=235627 RepID=UPI0024BA7F41|nr:GntR family transcriptional regulator [Arthrobacter sp. H35-MC1]MDJ0315669.1 GntR family transcriptional regulator [Arthrobacter sp. H35-MC1]
MSSMEILMRRWHLDTESSVPPFEQVRLRILDLASSGELSVGSKLPPVRALANDLGVAANTVARAYRELEQAGIVVTAGRSGTAIASGGDKIAAQVAAAADSFAAVVRDLGVPQAQALRIVSAALDNS